MPDSIMNSTAQGWPYLDGDNYVDLIDDYTAAIANKLETGQADIAAAANYAAQARAAAYGPTCTVALDPAQHMNPVSMNRVRLMTPAIYDPDGLASDANSAIIIKRTGRYTLTAAYAWPSGGGSRRLAIFDVVKMSLLGDVQQDCSTGILAQQCASKTVLLNAGDNIGIITWQTSGSWITEARRADSCWLQLDWVREA